MGKFKKNKLRNSLVIWGALLFTALYVTSCSLSPDKTALQKDSTQSDLNAWMKDNGKVKVCATNPIIAASVRRIGGDHVDVISLINPRMDPHSYEIVKGDGDKLSRANIVFANGLSLEHSGSMQRMLSSLPNVVFLADSIPEKEIIYLNGSPDPHIWMDLRLWSKTNDGIVKALSLQTPEFTKEYEENAALSKQMYEAKDKKICEQLQSINPKDRYLVTSHDAFHYFARRYLDENGDSNSRVISIYGLAPDEEISATEIRNVVNFVKENDVEVIFAEKNLSRDSLLKVVDSCRKAGTQVILSKDELYGDTLGNYTYIEMMNHNADVLERNLKGRPAPAKQDGCGCL